ncbi:hypothetical protein, partial [Staphylococcus aureus]
MGVGGGGRGDFGGFVVGRVLRGVDFIQVVTTILGH